MGTIYHSRQLGLPAQDAWKFVEAYTRSERHIFSNCIAERQEGDYRVVTTADGQEIWELNVAVDNDHMRASYTIAGVQGAEHHHASMQVFDDGDGRCTLVWITDFRPHALADALRPVYDTLFDDLVAAVTVG
jgi:hypothetical protein